MRYISFVLSLCLGLGVMGQTKNDLTQAKADYKNGDFAKALPVFEKEYKEKPTDPSLNLWLGACIVETAGDLKLAEEYLQTAAKKNLPEAYLYLGDIFVKQYRVSEAKVQYERYAKARPKEKETMLGTRNQYLAKLGAAIARTEDIQIIDSVVVNKDAFLSAYKLSPDAGSLRAFDDVFDGKRKVESVVYANGKGTKIYFGQPIEGGQIVLCSMDKLMNGYGNEKTLSENNLGLSGNTNYPFVLTDGSTIYFAAQDNNGLGGYDIYVTRYNFNTDSYLTPELLNMPFNSTANDYLYALDEEKGIGWFATDRFQPQGKVCVYTFIPNETIVLVESDDPIYKENRAKLSSIMSSWQKGRSYSSLVAAAKTQKTVTEKQAADFWFVINDKYTYTRYADFTSPAARNLYLEANEKRKTLTTTEKELEEKRTAYSSASGNKQSTLKATILNLENKQEQLHQEVHTLEVKARNEEINSIK